MTRIIQLWIVCAILLASALAPGESREARESMKNEPDVARKRAMMYYKRAEWQKAQEAAKSATVLAPEDHEAWLLLGSCEQRLENYDAAIDAFERYLELVPNNPKAPQVTQRIEELKLRDRTKAKTTHHGVPDAYSGKGSGFFIGGSPLFLPQTRNTTELASTMGWAAHLGFEVSDTASLGFRYAMGKEGLSGAAGNHQIFELFINPRIIFNRPYRDLGLFQLYLPLFFSFPYTMLNISGVTYSNFAANIGGGFGIRIYTKSLIAFDIIPAYHFGIPFSPLKSTSAGTATTAAGRELKGQTTGFDLRLQAVLFFR